MSVEVVRGGVVLAELALGRAREAADGEIEAGRVELPLVPTPGDEVAARWPSSVRAITCAAATVDERVRLAGFACT